MQHEARPSTREARDAPLETAAEDLFGRAGFTATIARTIMELDASDGAPVIAVQGSWGSGKTSILNLVESQIEAEARGKYRVLRFNPWYIRDTESMITCFFAEVEKVLGGVGEKKRRVPILPSRKNLATFLRMVGGVMHVPEGTLRTVSAWVHDPSLEYACEEIRKLLEKMPENESKALIVVVDDIDRLETSELLLMLKVVRLTAQLPRIVYLLAYDEKIAIDQLSSAYAGAGLARLYLEKIVQRPFIVPVIPVERFLDYVVRRTENAIRQQGFYWIAADKELLAALVAEGFRYRLKTPRQAIRFTTTLHTVLKLLQREADPLQQVALEGLRIFYPDVFCVICELRSDEFVSEGADRILERARCSTGEGLSPEEREGAKVLLEFLLHGTSPSIKRNIDRPQPMASAEYFDRYFSYEVDSRFLKQAEKRALFDPARGGESHARYLDGFRAERFFQTFPELLRHAGGCREVAATGSDQMHVFRRETLDREIAVNLLRVLASSFGAACDHWSNSDKHIHAKAALVLKRLLRFSQPAKSWEVLDAEETQAAAADLLQRIDHLHLAQKLYSELGTDSLEEVRRFFGDPSENWEFWTSPAFSREGWQALGGLFSRTIESRADADASYLFRRWAPGFLSGLDIWRRVDSGRVRTWVEARVEKDPDLGVQLLEHYGMAFGMSRDVDDVLCHDAFRRLKAALKSGSCDAPLAQEHAELLHLYENAPRV